MKELDFLIKEVKNANNLKVIKAARSMSHIHYKHISELSGIKRKIADKKYERLQKLINAKERKLLKS